MHTPGRALESIFPGQQDLKHPGTEFPVLFMSLVTFWLEFSKTFKFGEDRD